MRHLVIVLRLFSALTVWGLSPPAVKYQDAVIGEFTNNLTNKSAIQHEGDVDRNDVTNLGTVNLAMDYSTAAYEEQQASEEEQQAAYEEQQASEEEEQAACEEQQASEEEEQAAYEEQQASEEEQQAAYEEQQASEEEQQAAYEEQQASEEEEHAHYEEQQASEEDQEVDFPDFSTQVYFPNNYSNMQIDLEMDSERAAGKKQQRSDPDHSRGQPPSFYQGDNTEDYDTLLNDDFFTTDSYPEETTTALTDAPLRRTPARGRTANHLRKVEFVDMSKPHHLLASASHVHTMVANMPKDEEINFLCPDPFGYFADPNGNCSVYYACKAGTAQRRVCPEGMHFNPVSKLCDYKSEARCEIKCLEMNGRFYIPGYCDKFLECNLGQGRVVKCPAGLHYNAITKQCDARNKAACEITCSADHDMLVNLPGRCEMFARCLEGNATYHLCPHGLHFNPVLLTCDWPQDAGCEIECPFPDGYFPVLRQCSSYIVCRNNHAKVESCPSHLHFNFLLHTCDLPTKAGCNMECQKPNGFFPVPGVCSFFLMCLGGIPMLKRCPKDLEFDAATGQCADVPKDHCLPHCPEDSGTFPVDDHCDLYVRCSNGQPLVKRCPGNLHFNALFKQCDTPQRAKCELRCPYPSGVYPIPGKCDKFYQCVNSTAYIHSCSEGLHFNARTQTCDWPASAQCKVTCPSPEGYSPVQGDCTAYVSCTYGRPTLKKCPFGKHFNFKAKRCDLPQNADCVPRCDVDNIIFPLPGHCDSYLHCEDGVPHVDSCPPGLLFNHDTGMCDMPENVKCQSWS